MSAPVDWEPLAPLVPDQAPEALHDVALVVDQVSVELAPLATMVGFAAKVTTGGGELTETVVDWVALAPSAAAQVSV